MSERLNVKGMMTEPIKSSEYRFNPHEEISEADRQAVTSYLESFQESPNWPWLRYGNELASAKLLGIEAPISAVARKGIQGQLLAVKSSPEWTDYKFARLACDARILGVLRSLIETQKAGIEKLGEKYRRDRTCDFFLKLSFFQKVLEMPVDVSGFNKEKVDEALADTNPKDWLALAEIFASTRVLGIEFDLAPWRRERMRNFREDARARGDWQTWLPMAAREAIIYADKITIPEGGGLELSFQHKPSVVSDDSSPLPQTRNF